MYEIFCKIPVIRSFVRAYLKVKFQNRWRQINPHNETSIGNIFPIEIVSVGKGSYGILNIRKRSVNSVY